MERFDKSPATLFNFFERVGSGGEPIIFVFKDKVNLNKGKCIRAGNNRPEVIAPQLVFISQ